jgi:hypothetical protein
MIAHIAGTESRFAPTQHSSGTSFRLNCYLLFKKKSSMYVHLFKHVGSFSNICVRIVNMRNVFYYKILEYAHCLQQVQLRLTLYKWWGQLTTNFSQGACSLQTNREKATVTNRLCLPFLGIGLCHTHLPAPQLEGWS